MRKRGKFGLLILALKALMPRRGSKHRQQCSSSRILVVLGELLVVVLWGIVSMDYQA